VDDSSVLSFLVFTFAQSKFNIKVVLFSSHREDSILEREVFNEATLM
jgi:hypothetical protein